MKKVRGLGFALLMLLMVTPTPVFATYTNISAAVTYAKNWYSKCNHNCSTSYSSCSPWSCWGSGYCGYASHAGDCADFVSQCLLAGGHEILKKGNCRGFPCGKEDIGATRLMNCLYLSFGWKNDGVGYRKAPPSDIKVGDVLVYCDGTGDWNGTHATFIVGRSGSSASVAAHSSSTYGSVYTYLSDSSHAYYHWVHNPGVVITKPATPASVSASGPESGYAVVFKWSAVTGATSYKVARRPSGGAWTYWNGLTTANEPAIGWPAMYHTPGVGKFDFAALATNTAGDSAWKYLNAITVPDQKAPAVPAGLAATAPSATSVKLTWTAVSGATGYTVYGSSVRAEVDDRCYKKTPTGDGQTWTGLAYVTDGLRDNTNYGSSPIAAQANVWITFSPAVELHKYNFRLWDGDNRIYEKVYARWYDTAGAYFNPHGWRAYRTEGAFRLSATADVKCTKLGLSFASGSGNTANAQNHVTVMEAHGGYLAKTTAATYTINNLQQNTSYYFRIDAYKATSPEVISYSCPVVICHTPKAADATAPAVPTLALPANASTNSTGKPVFDWSDVTDPSGVTYELQVANNAAFTSPTINLTGQTASTHTPATVLASATYSWRVRAKDGAGNYSAWSGAWTVVVNVGDSTPPPMPALVSPANASAQSSNNITFDWSDVTDPSGVTYEVQIDNNADFSSPAVNQTALAVSTYANTVALGNGTFYWRVRAKDGKSNYSSWSASRSFTITINDAVPPAVPTLTSPANSAALTSNSVAFDWTDVTDPSGVSYELQVAKETAFTTIEISKVDIATSAYTAASGPGNGTHYWRVRAKDGAGNYSAWAAGFSFSIATTGDSTAPTNPTTCNAYIDIEKSAELTNDTWTNVSDTPYFEWTGAADSDSGVAGYSVYWGADSAGSPELVKDIDQAEVTAYTPSQPAETEKTYYLRVRTLDNNGNWSDAATLFTYKYDKTAPVNPASVLAWTNDTKTKELFSSTGSWQNIDAGPYFEWTGATDAIGISGYSIYWGNDNATSIPDTVTKAHAVPTKYFADPADPEVETYLILKTQDLAGNWSDQQVVFTHRFDNIGPLAPNKIAPEADAVTTALPSFSWDSVDDISGISYEIEISQNSDFSSTNTKAANLTLPSYTATTALTSGTYYWRVRGVDGVGNAGVWSTGRAFKTDITPPLPVTGLTAENAGGGDVKLDWTPATDAVSGIASYNIYRSETSGQLGTKVNTESVIDLQFYDNGTTLTSGAVYYYTVTPVDLAGNECVTGNAVASITIDKTGVSVSSVGVDYDTISPNEDGVQDSAKISYTINPAANVTIEIYDGTTLVKTLVPTGQLSAGTYNATWDGAEALSGSVDTNKTYTYKITAASSDGKTTVREGKIEVDVIPPENPVVTVSNSVFSPNGDGNRDNTMYGFTLKEPLQVVFKIVDASDNTIKESIIQGKAGLNSVFWDGRNSSGTIVADGTYNASVLLIDKGGNESEVISVETKVDRNSGWIMGYIYDIDKPGGNVAENRIGNAFIQVMQNGQVIESVNAGAAGTANVGYYQVIGLPSGTYDISILAKRYEGSTQKVVVEVGKIKWASIGLKYVGGATQPPVVEHVPLVSISAKGNKVQFAASAIDDEGVSLVTLKYQLYVGQDKIDEGDISMVDQGGIYVADLMPDKIIDDVTMISYRIIAADTDGSETIIPGADTWYYTELANGVKKYLGSDGGKISLVDANTEDGVTEVKVPVNAIASQTEFSISQPKDSVVPELKGTNDFMAEGVAKPVETYEIGPSGMVFDQPMVISLLYMDIDQDGFVDYTSYKEDNLGIFWYDGDNWRFVGGIVDKTKNTVTARVMHFSMYGIFPVKSMQIDASVFKPKEKVITPNSDNKNDFAFFNGINNVSASITMDGLVESPKIYVYDLNNKLVRMLEDKDTWDGKDELGQLVENGVYIYQYELNGQRVSGSLVVAK
ncbi:MAG: FlgD immunoglobulin-like domain containing protein [Elusimicrobiota bacterium]